VVWLLLIYTAMLIKCGLKMNKRVEYINIREERRVHTLFDNTTKKEYVYIGHIQRWNKQGDKKRVKSYEGISHYSVKRLYDIQDKLMEVSNAQT